MACAASATISGLRQFSGLTRPPSMAMAAVAITVRGHNALTAMPAPANSALMPSTHRLMPYLAMVYAVWSLNHLASRLGGGDIISTCGLDAFCRYGRAARVVTNVPRVLTWCIRSKRFIGVSAVPASQIALALLTTMSMPPKCSAVSASASATRASSRMSTLSGRALPPAASISAAAVWMVPGNLGLGAALLAAMATLAPSRAARSAMARPMPREAPVMNRVLPASVVIVVSASRGWVSGTYFWWMAVARHVVFRARNVPDTL